MSTCRRTWLPVIIAFLFAALATVNASPIQPTARQLVKELERPQVRFVPARVGWSPAQRPTADFNLTYEQYGPQATARAVRASLLATLTPDPLASAALLFCAFCLRWVRLRKSDRTPQIAEPQAIPEEILPKAA